MEIRITTRQVLRLLYIIAWIIFIGLSIEAGAFIFNGVITMTVNPEDARYFWREVDLSALYQFDHAYFLLIAMSMSITAVLKALIFYRIIKILHENKLDMAAPFRKEVLRFIFVIASLTFLTGLFSLWGSKYADLLVKRGVEMPGIQYLRLGGADVWLFMSVILFVIAQIFKRGMEIQSENELTV